MSSKGSLRRKLTKIKKKTDKNNEQLDAKDKMLNELAKKNEDLEDKITSLLDLLYRCNDCGRHGDYCECDDMEGNDVELPGGILSK